jgi:hypothetical protein
MFYWPPSGLTDHLEAFVCAVGIRVALYDIINRVSGHDVIMSLVKREKMNLDTTISSYAVVGADLDISLVKTLVEGDNVLLEMNGMRMFAPQGIDCPLLSEQPWSVVSNDGRLLKLSHPRIKDELTLPYECLIRSNLSPAVFRIMNPAYGTDGPIFVILQFIGHYLAPEEAATTFQNHFNESRAREEFEDDNVRMGMLELWSKTLQSFRQVGFGHKSLKRLALRADISEQVLRTIRDGEAQDMLNIDIESIIKLHRAFCWTHHFLNQNKLVQHDTNNVFCEN